MRKGIILSLITVLTVFTACKNSDKKVEGPGNNKAGEKQPPMRVEGFVAKAVSYAQTIEVPGNINANESVEIHPEVSGRVVSLNLNEGKIVQKGELLAKLFDGDLVAQLKKLEVQLKLAETTEERQSRLLKIQGISQQDYDISLLQVNNLKADIGIIKTSIAKTEIRAPFNGKLGLKNISVGAYVSSQTVIATINQTDKLNVDFSIPEKYIGLLKNGQVVSFKFEGSKKECTAKVFATESNITENSRSLTVRATVTNKPKELMPGSFATVKVAFDADPNTILIPNQAILPQARGKKVVVIKNGEATFLDVTTGNRDADNIQIIEGISLGDTVVTTGLLAIKPGSKIQISKIINAKQ
jgi:membrane fusion protein (multidrug efflux system)